MIDPARVQVLISRLDPGLPLPRYAHPGDAGVDLYAREDLTLPPGHRALVATGVNAEGYREILGLQVSSCPICPTACGSSVRPIACLVDPMAARVDIDSRAR